MTKTNETVRVLFICMGNICRSPAAQGVMEKFVADRGLEERVVVDSAGTLDYHEGELADPRMRHAATRRGYELTHRSRPVRPHDFLEFDYVVAMDDANLEALERFRPGRNEKAVISLLLSHWDKAPRRDVPDPYYGGKEGFENVLDLVEGGCAALLDSIEARHGLR